MTTTVEIINESNEVVVTFSETGLVGPPGPPGPPGGEGPSSTPKLFFGSTQPTALGPYLWVKSLGGGNFTLMYEDGL